MIDKSAFHDPMIFEREVAKIYSRGWQFACMSQDVAKHRDYVCVDMAGSAMVIQNFRGQLRAFLNVCPHRFNRIQPGERGNRPLLCSYHGWNFNADGFPFGMPRKEDYLGDGRDSSDLCLEKYPVEVCGGFIFVDRSRDSKPLRYHLGRYWDDLVELSRHMGQETHFSDISHEANWKILIENVMDVHHCSIVHRDTFVPNGFCTVPAVDLMFDGAHSSYHGPKVEPRRAGLRRRLTAHLDNREYRHNSFYHIHIFPNLFIASTEGAFFYVGQLLPRSVHRTVLRVRYFEPRVELSEKNRVRQDALNAASVQNGLAVVEEDRLILEQIQIGIGLSNRPGAISPQEERVCGFMDKYAELMKS